NAPANGECWRSAHVEAARERVLQRLAAFGLPFENCQVADLLHPGRFAREYLAPGGAIYGTHSHGWKHAFFRPPNRSPQWRGLYFVGGSSHPGGGTPTVLYSAKITAGMIHADSRS